MYRRLIANTMGAVTAGALLLMLGCSRSPSGSPSSSAASPGPSISSSATSPGSSMTAGAQPTSPIPHAHIYPDVQAAHTDIQTALVKARKEHKRVLVDFGGDWCGDCQVLNYYMHQSPNRELLEKYYVPVDVNIGHIDQNIAIGDRYGVVLKKGVPAMAVLRADGTVVYGQANGEFKDMRTMQSSDLTTFLEAWRPEH